MYVKLIEDRPTLSATKMDSKRIYSFWQYVTYWRYVTWRRLPIKQDFKRKA